MGSTCKRETTFSGLRISSASVSACCTSSSMVSSPIVLLILLPVIKNADAKPRNSHHCALNGVITPRNRITPDTMYITRGIPNSCLINIPLKSAALDPFVIRIPVAREISKEGICDTRPSPIVKIPYLLIASPNASD